MDSKTTTTKPSVRDLANLFNKQQSSTSQANLQRQQSQEEIASLQATNSISILSKALKKTLEHHISSPEREATTAPAAAAAPPPLPPRPKTRTEVVEATQETKGSRPPPPPPLTKEQRDHLNTLRRANREETAREETTRVPKKGYMDDLAKEMRKAEGGPFYTQKGEGRSR